MWSSLKLCLFSVAVVLWSSTFMQIGNCPEELFIKKPQFLNEVLLLKKQLHKLLKHQSRSRPIPCRLVKTRCQRALRVVWTVFVQSEGAIGCKYTNITHKENLLPGQHDAGTVSVGRFCFMWLYPSSQWPQWPLSTTSLSPLYLPKLSPIGMYQNYTGLHVP